MVDLALSAANTKSADNSASSEVKASYLALWQNRFNNVADYFAYREAFDKLLTEEKESLEARLKEVPTLTPKGNVTRSEVAMLLGRNHKYISPLLVGSPFRLFRLNGHRRSQRLYDRETIFSAFYEREKNKKKGGTKRKLSATDLEDIVLGANCGVEWRELAKIHNVSYSTIDSVVMRAAKSGDYNTKLLQADKLRNALAAYKKLPERITQPVENYIEKFLVKIPFAFDPYVMLLDSIRPGTLGYLKENLAQMAKQTAIAETFAWLRRANFGERTDAVAILRSHVKEFYKSFFSSAIPGNLQNVIDSGLSELEQSTGAKTRKILNLGTVVRQYFFEGKNTSAIARDSVTPSAVGQHLSKGVGWLRAYIDGQLGYGSLEALLKASVEERLRTNA